MNLQYQYKLDQIRRRDLMNEAEKERQAREVRRQSHDEKKSLASTLKSMVMSL